MKFITLLIVTFVLLQGGSFSNPAWMKQCNDKNAIECINSHEKEDYDLRATLVIQNDLYEAMQQINQVHRFLMHMIENMSDISTIEKGLDNSMYIFSNQAIKINQIAINNSNLKDETYYLLGISFDKSYYNKLEYALQIAKSKTLNDTQRYYNFWYFMSLTLERIHDKLVVVNKKLTSTKAQFLKQSHELFISSTGVLVSYIWSPEIGDNHLKLGGENIQSIKQLYDNYKLIEKKSSDISNSAQTITRNFIMLDRIVTQHAPEIQEYNYLLDEAERKNITRKVDEIVDGLWL